MAQQLVPTESPSGCLVRLFWMGIGNIVLLVCAIYIVHTPARFLSFADLGYWLSVLAMIAVRYVDIHRYGGATATGEPATTAHWRRYAIRLTAGALVAWIGIHLLALTGILSPTLN
ncbi:MAG: hypothetical protein PHW60_00180 [Kiritimatiellae bacterium]|nr:hypothetical protein [Kiritimatiellia bacterium]